MDRRVSTAIELPKELVDQNGQARFMQSSWDVPVQQDLSIAPFLDMEPPPTPPPKPYHMVPQTQVHPLSSHRAFGFPSKASFSSLVTLRQNSTTSLVRTNGGSSIRSSDSVTLLSVPESARHSTDDAESSRGMFYSGSSTHSGEIRKSKSSYSLFSKFTSRPSKVSLRPESDEPDHPSLHPPEPHVPHQRSAFFNGSALANGSTPTIVSIPSSTLSKGKQKVKKKPSSKLPPSPPPKDVDIPTTQGNLVPGGETSIIEVSPEDLEGIVDFKIVAGNNNPPLSIPPHDPSSPSSGFESTQSLSDHSSHHRHRLTAPEFSDPFKAGSSKRQHQIYYDRKVSPKTINPPPPERHEDNETDSQKDARSPSWAAPPSWDVKPVVDQDPDQLDNYNSDSDREKTMNGLLENGAGKLRNEERVRRRARNAASASFSSQSVATRGSRGTLGRLPYQPPPGVTYKMRLYRPNSSYHVLAIDLETTVATLMPRLVKKIINPDAKKKVELDLCVKEKGCERVLGMNEKPAGIVKLRMEQAGYDYEDGLHLLGTENLSILLRFSLKEPHLENEHIDFDNYEVVDLSGAGFRAIPPVLHRNSDQIICLRLTRNPMIKIPSDFIQSCTALKDLRLTYMSLKKIPEGILHSPSLQRIDISCNAIRDLNDADFTKISGLYNIQASNNRLDKLPTHFGSLKALTMLNISNNRFREFPSVITQITTLRELDISFNVISELPEDFGVLQELTRLILIGNQLSKFPASIVELAKLEILDIRRNQILDLSLVCNLPSLANLNLDHNAVHALDLPLTHRLKYLVASHNDITHFSLLPCIENKPPYSLTVLDLSYAKLYSIDEETLGQLTSLRVLKLDHNSIRSLPDSLGDLEELEALSCTDNKLDSIPSTIGRLQRLHTLDTHNNNLSCLPESIWDCGALAYINLTSNFVRSWPDPPVCPVQESSVVNGNLAAPTPPLRKGSVASLSPPRPLPLLVHCLQKLYIGENCLTDNSVLPLMIFKELRVLNLSFNEIQDLPGNFFRNMLQLKELYLSGNKLTSIPSEDLHRLHELTTIYLNGNRLVTLPQELGQVDNLTVLDAGSNVLKYNVNNYEFDWNWNFNKKLKYLNLSGNKRLQIKAEAVSTHQRTKPRTATDPAMLSGFTSLQQLKVLGLMDVTIIHTAQDATVDIPDEGMDCRVRTSLSTVCGMGYGIADSLGQNDSLTMLDLVHEFRNRPNEALFAMIGRTHPPKFLKQELSLNRLSKYLHDNFVNVFKAQLAYLNEKQDKEGIPTHLRKEGIPKALRWTFLKLNQDLHGVLQPTRKNSQVSLNPPFIPDPMYSFVGVSGIAVYFCENTLYAANVGDALAVVSRQGSFQEISRKHDPFDRLETVRIRGAEGWISPGGLVNDEVDVSRSFGYFHIFPHINAQPDVLVYDLSDMDEFVIIANHGLWDFVPYQTAVDIARSTVVNETPDPMLAAQKLRDFAMSYGADGSTMVMVLWVADLFNHSRPRQPTLDPSIPGGKKGQDIGTKFLPKELPPPTGHITIVFTDIRNSTHLWEANRGMRTAMHLHNTLLRRQLRLCGGYEVKTEGDAFMCSFSDTLAAVWFCLTVQVQLLDEPWPSEILECEDGKTVRDAEGRIVARGLSVRMGIHCGSPLCEPDLVTHRMDYFGPMVNRSARIQSSALGGQIACSNDIVNEIRTKVYCQGQDGESDSEKISSAVAGIRDIGVEIIHVGETKLKGIELPEILSILYPTGLEGRHNLKETPPDLIPPTPTLAPVPPVVFSVDNLQKLGMLCLQTEALSTNRRFREIPERKGSVLLDAAPQQEEETTEDSKIFYANPALLLPPINNKLSESELLTVLDSLSLRISNAVNTITQQRQPPPVPQVEETAYSNVKKSLLDALTQDAVLDQETIRYISSILDRP